MSETIDLKEVTFGETERVAHGSEMAIEKAMGACKAVFLAITKAGLPIGCSFTVKLSMHKPTPREPDPRPPMPIPARTSGMEELRKIREKRDAEEAAAAAAAAKPVKRKPGRPPTFPRNAD